MKLLVITQAVDQNDSDLGFFCRWLTEFARHAERVEVLTLREGTHSLPQNVVVHQLGKGKIRRALQVIRFAWVLKYDAVFVHMNPEYLVVAGWLWRVLGKKTALWYTHKSVDLKLRIAVLFASIIFTASKESFRLRSKKVRVMGHGIDTDFFTPDQNVARGSHILSVGRLMQSKRHDLAIEAAAREGREVRIAGEGPLRKELESLA
ncbi:MAG: hypothetical protein AAB964_01545, partial [Patescibacteria group bacterium]